jgi:DNA-binding SARP family transcriptional activator
MKPRHQLRCMGQPALFAPNGDPIKFRTKKHLALLVYLAVEDLRSHRRDRLAELLWPKAETAEARHSLATALSILRPLLGIDALTTSREHVSLDHDRLSLDLERLVSKDVLGSETSGALDVAPFLEDFDIPDAPEFAMWKDRQQARLLPMVKDALLLLMHRCRRTGESRQIEQLADRLLSLDDFSEEAVIAKMEARALAGDRLMALKLFEDWKARLFAELRAIPSASVDQLAARLRRGGWGPAVNDIPTLSVEHSRERLFVGRGKEFTLLYETWTRLKHGKSIHSLILGDSGVGKTTLVERVTTVAALEGASVVKVQSYDLERAIPFATLSGLIVGLLDKPGASATPPEALAELARVSPAVTRRFSCLPTPNDAQGEAARIRLTEAFQQLVHAVAEEYPTILVVDDLHLADEPSLAAIHFVLRREASQRVIAIFTGRPGEIGRSTQAAILRESLGRLGGQEFVLAPLSREQGLELLRSLLQLGEPRPTAREEADLLSASGGLPMVLELLVQDWRKNGSSSIALALEAMTADFFAGAAPVDAFAPILSRLSGNLEPASKRALDLASVLGHRLNDLPMYQVIDLSMGQTMVALGQLADMRVLRDGNNRLEFANELIRAHVYSSIPTSVRKALHASVAERLTHRREGDSPPPHLEIAWHTMRGGCLTDAIGHLLEGAREAMRLGAPQSAERALTSAMASLRAEDQTQAMFLLVEAMQEQGRWLDSLNVCRALADMTDERRRQEAFALASLAKSYLGGWLSQELLHLLPALKDIIRSCPHVASRIRAARAVAQAISLLRARAIGEELLDLVRGIPTSDLDADWLSQLCLTRAMLLYQAGRTEESIQEASLALKRLQGRGTANTVAVQLQSGLGVMRSLQGRFEESTSHYECALRTAERLGNDSLANRIGANLALAYGRLGRFEDQLAFAEAVPSVVDSELTPWRDIQLAFSKAFAHAMLGRVAKAKSVIEEFDARLGPDIESSYMQRWLLWKADVLMVSGLRVEARLAASGAVEDHNFRLEACEFAGPFARWVAIVGQGSSTLRAKAREVLSGLEEHLDDFDAMDRVEILCAAAHIQPGGGTQYRRRIAEMLQLLPSCTASNLRTLGMNLDL